MKTSNDRWERQAGKIGEVFKLEEIEKGIIEKIYKAGTHAYLGNPQIIAVTYENYEYFRNKQPPLFHISLNTLR